MNKFDSNTLYQEAEKHGILPSQEAIAERIEELKKAEILKQYTITYLQKEKRYSTNYYDENGKRKQIRKPSREAVEKELIRIISEMQHNEKLTLKQVYEEWLPFKIKTTNSSSTIRRHEQHWDKYFKQTPFVNKPIKDISSLECEEYCNGIVKSYNLTSKEWCTASIVIRHPFIYAYKKGYIDSNPMDDLKISVKYRQPTRKKSFVQVYSKGERQILFGYLHERFAKTKHPAFLAIELNFYLGLRVGELVALKWSDIENGLIHVHSSEIHNVTTGERYVEPHTKTYHDRFVPIPPRAQKILDKLKKISEDQEYIFVMDGERITEPTINRRLERFAISHKFPVKESHCIRRTYASELYRAGLPMKKIQELLGHSNIETTMKYLYDPCSEEESLAIINEALS